MPQVKIEILNFVKRETVPVHERNTVASQLAQQLVARLKQATTDQAMPVRIPGAKKWMRYSLQKRLQKVFGKGGESIHVTRGEGDVFFVTR